MRVCTRVCVRVCVCACVRECVCAYLAQYLMAPAPHCEAYTSSRSHLRARQLWQQQLKWCWWWWLRWQRQQKRQWRPKRQAGQTVRSGKQLDGTRSVKKGAG